MEELKLGDPYAVPVRAPVRSATGWALKADGTPVIVQSHNHGHVTCVEPIANGQYVEVTTATGLVHKLIVKH